jgi:hypothetical protein
MAEIIDSLEERLENLDLSKKRRLIHRVYKEIVPGPRGRPQKSGRFKEYMTTGAETLEKWVFISYVIDQLEELNMHHRANYLREFYTINDEVKGDLDSGLYEE